MDAYLLTVESLLDKYGDALIRGGAKVVGGILVLVIGLWITKLLGDATRRLAMRHSRVDVTMAAFFASIVRYGGMIIVAVAALDQLGVATTQIIAVLGAMTLAIGLALQGTLSNVAAGVMLALFRPYRLGELVEIAGRQGTVKDVNIFTTELATGDNVKVIVPNSQIWAQPMSNFSALGTRMFEISFRVLGDTDLDKAIALLVDAMKADPRTLQDPPPRVRVTAVGDFAVTLLAQGWATSSEQYSVKMDLTKTLKQALDQAGIHIR